MTYRSILLLAALALAACSKSGGSNSPAGSGGSGGTSSLAQQLCPDACKTVKTCYAGLDTAACEAQCGKELTGSGYFIPEFAKEYFEKLKDVGTDPQCKVTNLDAWQLGPGQSYDAGIMDDPSVVTPCVDNATTCTGQKPQDDLCFLGYYVYNSQYRAEFKACYDKGCAIEGSCLCDAAVPWRAWVAIPVDPNDPVHSGCPPSD